ncbi:molecular chaperone DnaJ [Prochlorococcus marinus]|uniref:molecular chaperone DnaJ n=1 Tax=Prochlorococcus marinus TaxID=1219 RepID=UPI0022B553DF|nr:molecular chaperone DnaJ [Prochlorococcus marinus]
MATPANEGSRRISVDLPNELIERFDELKKAWGLRKRGAVLERLLETLFDEEEIHENDKEISNKQFEYSSLESSDIASDSYLEDNSIVLISTDKLAKSTDQHYEETIFNKKTKEKKVVGIDLPNFVNRRANKLKTSLSKGVKKEPNYESIITGINEEDIEQCIDKTLNHWVSLYGNNPKEEVIEAAMIWFARDIWPYIDDSENIPFTWNAAIYVMSRLCPSWQNKKPSFENIIVMAGVLEDPLGSINLKNRLPSLVKRFVNCFKRRRNVTSFETLESTMTVHGALKLLDLPITAGKSISLTNIRDAYKIKALANHPDSGGSTESMRQINEAYQLLKDLYKKK